MQTHIFRATTDKDITEFIKDLGRSMAMYGFIIHNEDRMEMVRHFGHHGVQLAADFDLHMVQVCAPKRSAESLRKNLERAVWLPKFIIVFTRDGRTQVRVLRFSTELVRELVDDEEFPEQNAEMFDNLIQAIKNVL